MDQYPAGYNAPASINLNNPSGSWRPDVFVDASFIYWRAEEDGLDIANSGALVFGSVTPLPTVASFTNNIEVLEQEFEYKPGFKVGLGVNFWEWDVALQYTWVRQSTSVSKTAPTPSPNTGEGIWNINNWFLQPSGSGQSLSAPQFSSRWHLAMDLLDLEVGRAYYEGRNLTIAPFMGLRAAWIRQSLHISGNIPSQLISNSSGAPAVSRNSSHSWALGPRAGLDAFCLLPRGFRLQGDIAGSLLFTQYTTVRHSENVLSTTAQPPNISMKISNYNCVRPVAEIGLGLGWGSYLYGQKYHIDFSATYDFNLFWQQNMMRKLVDQAALSSGAAVGYLDLHGLTLMGRFDF